VHFVEDLPFRGDALPVLVCPFEHSRVDYSGRAMGTLRLEPRGGVGIRYWIIVQVVPVQCSRTGLGDMDREVAGVFSLQVAGYGLFV
jgi:hypothetical protein